MTAKNVAVFKAKPPKTAEITSDYVALAIERGVPPEILSKLIDNAARIDAIKARKAFDAAMSQAKMPVIVKNREASFGQGRGYKFEDLAQIATAVEPVLAEQGLSYRFRTATNNDKVTVTCIVSHRDGHSEENSLSASPDTSGSKNSIQAIGSAVTYLQRYTLKAALGLSASIDDDGHAAERREEKKPEQVKIEPKPVAAPHDPETGEIKPPHPISAPHKEDSQDPDWIGYGSLILAAIKTAKDKNEIDEWLDQNNHNLTAMETDAPKVYKRLMSAIGK
jgi:hypothetical protein